MLDIKREGASLYCPNCGCPVIKIQRFLAAGSTFRCCCSSVFDASGMCPRSNCSVLSEGLHSSKWLCSGSSSSRSGEQMDICVYNMSPSSESRFTSSYSDW